MENKTKICCFDVDKSIIAFLSEEGFDVYGGSLGTKVRVNNYKYGDETHLWLNYDIPNNIHEYDILIDEMHKPSVVPYVEEDHVQEKTAGQISFYFVSKHPDNIFDPIPFGCYTLGHMLERRRVRPMIKIIFQDVKYHIRYDLKSITDTPSTRGTSSNVNNHSYSNYEYFDEELDFYLRNHHLEGTNVKLDDNNFSQKIFGSFLGKILYKQTFQVPTILEKRENDINKKLCFPLLKNQVGDVVSFAFFSKNDITIMFPQMDVKTKVDLLKHFFYEILYKDFSEYFPTVEANAWTNIPQYHLPNHDALLQEKEANKRRFEETNKQLDEQISLNTQEYAFLHKILTETGTELVNAIITFLKWLGFEKVIAMDETSDNGLLEEDIQIDLGEKGLLVIEVKGIGRTSTDSDCSQINKIKLRICEERKSFDVYALYIVNNERHIEPLKRHIPPFNPRQIQDAKNEKRGMAYTWQFFNLYFNIENGFITNAEAQERFLQHGLIDFTPDLIDLGEPYRYYQGNQVVCIELNDAEVKVGDFVAYEIDGRFYKQEIIGIEQEQQSFTVVKNGKTGFMLKNPIPNVKKVFLL